MTQSVLITSGTGFVAQWLVRECIKNNFNVITTVRSVRKEEVFEKDFPDEIKSGQLKFEMVPDLAVPGTIDNILANHTIDVIFAVASPYDLYAYKDIKNDLVDPTIEMAKDIFMCAAKAGVKRIVYTGSIVDVVDRSLGASRDYTYTEKDFNPATYELAVKSADPYTAYSHAKTLAEQEVWKLQKLNSSTEVVFLLPPWIIGPALLPYEHAAELSTSNKILHQLLPPHKRVFMDNIMSFIDGRDVARAHVAAAVHPAAANKRYIVAGESPFIMKNVVEIYNERFKLDVKPPPKLSSYWKVDTNLIETELDFKPEIGLEQCITEAGEQMQQLGLCS